MRLILLTFALAYFGSLVGCTKPQPGGPIPITEINPKTETAADAKRSELAGREAETRKSLINAEIEALPEHEWAGSYYEGDGLGVNVLFVLAPSNGYVFEWHGCMGLYDRNYGSIQLQEENLRLSFEFPNTRQGFQGISEKLLPVSWGDRRYLIPSDDVVGFCNDINSGDEPRNRAYGNYLLRDGDESKVVSGHPDLPTKFKHYLLDRPIEATIIEIGDVATRPSVCEWNFIDTEVVLDAGSDDGILPGMQLHVVSRDNMVPTIKIRESEGSKSIGVITDTDDEPAEIRTGWKFSTRPRWNN